MDLCRVNFDIVCLGSGLKEAIQNGDALLQFSPLTDEREI